MLSAAPVIGPTRRPTCPTSSDGSQCRPKAWVTSSSAPAAITSSAPPGMTSSAGWNSSRTRPASGRSWWTWCSAEPGTEQGGGVHVVAAGVGDVVVHAAPRVVGAVGDGQGVEVGPQGDDRPAVGSDVGDQPGLRQLLHPDALLAQPLGDQVGGALLGPGELGVGVQVAAEVDQLVVEVVDRCARARG